MLFNFERDLSPDQPILKNYLLVCVYLLFLIVMWFFFICGFLSQVLTKIFGDLTLVISFLLERFMLPLQMSSFTCSTVEGLPETPALCVSNGPGWIQSLSACLALVLPRQHGFCRFQLTMGLTHPVRGWVPHVWRRRCGWLLGPGLDGSHSSSQDFTNQPAMGTSLWLLDLLPAWPVLRQNWDP